HGGQAGVGDGHGGAVAGHSHDTGGGDPVGPDVDHGGTGHGAGHWRRSSRTAARASTPARQSSVVACSAGSWLIPDGLRTNSMAEGTWAARLAESWPAAVGHSR